MNKLIKEKSSKYIGNLERCNEAKYTHRPSLYLFNILSYLHPERKCKLTRQLMLKLERERKTMYAYAKICGNLHLLEIASALNMLWDARK